MTKEIGQIETSRLLLRRLGEEDVERIQLIGTDDIFEMVPEIRTPFDAAAWIKHKLENECPSVGHVIITKAEKALVGYVQVTHGITGEGHYLIVGYWLGRKYWRNGYASEAVAAVLSELLSAVRGQNQLIPVHAQVVPENVASRRVLEKCGFVCSGPPNGAANTGNMTWYHWPVSAARFHRQKRTTPT